MADPLAVLARLRRIETDRGKRVLAERLARLGAAEARVEAAAAARATERAAAAASPADHGTWLPVSLAEEERAALARTLAERGAAEARDALAAARAAERAVEMLAADRAARAARAALRAEQARLDDRAALRPGGA